MQEKIRGWNVAFDVAGAIKLYCAHNVDSHEEAEIQLNNFKTMYMKGDVGRRYPNGRGTYPFRNPRIVCIQEEH